MEIFDMTRAEVGLVVFIFLLVYCAGLLPKLVTRLVALAGSKHERERED